MCNSPQIILTDDGSHSLFVPELNETYHSKHGAVQESEHVFIQNGLYPSLVKKEINMLEVGMGTGLNLFLTIIRSADKDVKIKYTALEPFPIAETIIEQLNYATLTNTKDDLLSLFQLIHQSPFDKTSIVNDYFSLIKHKNTIQSFLSEQKFDLVYFDAFAPDKQPEMWTKDVFKKLFDLMKDEAHLVTYCAKGEVKRTLKSIGFTVESLPGPPGKREMTRAKK